MVRAFIIADNQMVRKGLVAYLDRHPGIEVVGRASSGAEAIELLKAVQPDVVIVDSDARLSLSPGAICRTLNPLKPNVRIVALSGDPDDAGRLRAAGYDHVVTKRVGSGDLAEAVLTGR